MTLRRHRATADLEGARSASSRKPVSALFFDAWNPYFAQTGALPSGVPAPIQTYLRGALRTGAVQSDAWQLYRDFSDLLAALWGKRKFIPFAMPARR